MAAELVGLLAGLGHERVAGAGHDRGARVAYRMALDHPDRVTRAAVVNVVPTVEQFERMAAGPSLGYWPCPPCWPSRRHSPSACWAPSRPP